MYAGIGRCPIQHRLHRNGAELRVDSDLWLCVLDLALAHGWKPVGVRPPGLSYVVPRGQLIDDSDARELARCFAEALPSVPDDVVSLTDLPFGDENTLALIANATQGSPPDTGRVAAAREILSGPPKVDAAALAEFLWGGQFAISVSG